MRIRKRYIWTASLCLYLAAVAYLCFMKFESMPDIRPDLWGIPIDKVAHFLMFMPYPVVAYGAFRGKERKLSRDLAVLTIAFVTGIGLAMGTEQIQGQLEYRSYDMKDLLADLTGMSFSTAVIFIYIMITKKLR